MSSGVFASFARKTLAPLATAVVLTVSSAIAVSGPADARLGGGSSFGSRGSRTFSMPSSTATAPIDSAHFENT